MPRLRFCFDFISPYAYLAWRALPALERETGVAAEPVPVLFAAVLNAHGTLGPAEVPAKRDYVFRDALRRARLAGWPLVPPPAHPFNPLLALRAVTAVEKRELQARIIDGLFAVAWSGARPVDERTGLDAPAVVRAVLEDAAGFAEAQRILDAAGSTATKDRVRAATAAAIEAGAFGVPTYLATDRDGRTELYWGYDTRDLVARFLREGELYEPREIERWRGLPAAAQRQRPAGNGGTPS